MTHRQCLADSRGHKQAEHRFTGDWDLPQFLPPSSLPSLPPCPFLTSSHFLKVRAFLRSISDLPFSTFPPEALRDLHLCHRSHMTSHVQFSFHSKSPNYHVTHVLFSSVYLFPWLLIISLCLLICLSACSRFSLPVVYTSNCNNDLIVVAVESIRLMPCLKMSGLLDI